MSPVLWNLLGSFIAFIMIAMENGVISWIGDREDPYTGEVSEAGIPTRILVYFLTLMAITMSYYIPARASDCKEGESNIKKSFLNAIVAKGFGSLLAFILGKVLQVILAIFTAGTGLVALKLALGFFSNIGFAICFVILYWIMYGINKAAYSNICGDGSSLGLTIVAGIAFCLDFVIARLP
jgi:hypothetical protein